MCIYKKDGSNLVQHYFNPFLGVSEVLKEDEPTVGLKNSKISFAQGFLTCSFSRAKIVAGINNYFDLNKNFYLLLAKGPLDAGWILVLNQLKI